MKQEGKESVDAAPKVKTARHHPSHEPTINGSSSVFPLDVSHPSEDIIRGQDPRIDMISGVIPPRPDSSRINRDDAVDDFGLGPGRNKDDDIARPDNSAIVGNNMETIPGPKERVHAGAYIINIFLFHLAP